MNVRARSAVTLAVLCVVLAAMVVIGWRSSTAAFPRLSDSGAQSCQNVKVRKVLYRRDVTVSVFNASSKSGYAGQTMGSMERRNFTVGTIGNAPATVQVTGVQVWTTSDADPRAELVARQYRPTAKIVVTDQNLGPGVDVVLGAGAPYPYVPAPKSLKLAKPEKTCLDKVTVNPSTGQQSRGG